MGIFNCKECKDCFNDPGNIVITPKNSYNVRIEKLNTKNNNNMNNGEYPKDDEKNIIDIIPTKIESKELNEINQNIIDSNTDVNKNILKNNDDNNNKNEINKNFNNNEENNVNNKKNEIHASLPVPMDKSSEKYDEDEPEFIEEDENDNNN